jgi:hypothetical protein
MAAEVGELARRGERGRPPGVERAPRRVEESCPLPCYTSAPPPWITPEVSGSRSYSMDLTGWGERAAIFEGVGASRWRRTSGVGALRQGSGARKR